MMSVKFVLLTFLLAITTGIAQSAVYFDETTPEPDSSYPQEPRDVMEPVPEPDPEWWEPGTDVIEPEPESWEHWGGMYRDPHVVLPLRNGVNLCFNWDGADHEVHNLIYHQRTGMAVNGMMVAAPAGIKSKSGKDRVYVHTVAFVIPLSQANIIITPSNITFKYHGLEPFTIEVTTQFSITRNGMSLYVYEVHGSMAKLQIDIDGIKYLVMLHPKSETPHVDLAFDDLTHKKTAGGLDGVIGQYYGKGVHLTKSEQGDQGVIRVGKSSSPVRSHVMLSNPITGQHDPCWFSSDGGRALSKGERGRFVVEGLESQPDYSKYDESKTSSDDGETLSQHSSFTALFEEE